MTYDDWKTRSDRDDVPPPEPEWWCEDCGDPAGYCDCPCCHEDNAVSPADALKLALFDELVAALTAVTRRLVLERDDRANQEGCFGDGERLHEVKAARAVLARVPR